MKLLPANPMPRFLLGILICMPLSLVFWWFIGRHYAINVLEKGVGLITRWLMADHIVKLTAENDLWVLTTSLSPMDDLLKLAAVAVSPIRFTVSLPLFWGLTLATPGTAKLKRLLLGTLLLFPIMLVMVLLFIQFELGLLINHKAALTEIPPGPYLLILPYPEVLYYLMGVGRQLALLILPTLAPLLVWGFLNRAFIRFIIFEGILAQMGKAPPFRPASRS